MTLREFLNSQTSPEAKAIAQELINALSDMTDGYHDYDLVGHTGLPIERCTEISEIASPCHALYKRN